MTSVFKLPLAYQDSLTPSSHLHFHGQSFLNHGFYQTHDFGYKPVAAMPREYFVERLMELDSTVEGLRGTIKTLQKAIEDQKLRADAHAQDVGRKAWISSRENTIHIIEPDIGAAPDPKSPRMTYQPSFGE